MLLLVVTTVLLVVVLVVLQPVVLLVVQVVGKLVTLCVHLVVQENVIQGALMHVPVALEVAKVALVVVGVLSHVQDNVLVLQKLALVPVVEQIVLPVQVLV